jgi:hypothetical protein
MLRIPYCVDSPLTDGGGVVSLMRRPRSTPHKHITANRGVAWLMKQRRLELVRIYSLLEKLQPRQIAITRNTGAVVQVSSMAYVFGAPSDRLVPSALLPPLIWSDLCRVFFLQQERSSIFDRRSVGQSVLVSGRPLGPMTILHVL